MLGVLILAVLFCTPLVMVLVVLHVVWTRRERDLAVLMGYLASVTSRGYPLAGALQALADSTRGRLARVLNDVGAGLEGGLPLSVAMSRHPRLMPADYLPLIESGEASGGLGAVFRVLRRHERREAGQRAHLFLVAAYPLLVFWMLGAAASFFRVLLAPKFGELAAGFGVESALPLHDVLLPAQLILFVLLGLSFLVALVAFPAPLRLRREGHLSIVDKLKWWVPVSRRHEKYRGIRLFAESLEIQLRGGLPFREALARASEVAVNAGVRRRLRRMNEEVERGGTLSDAAAHSRLFPSRFVQLLRTAETGGDMLPVLEEITSGSIDACDRIVQAVTLVTVPTAVLLLGSAVATLGAAFFRFLVQVMTNLTGGAT